MVQEEIVDLSGIQIERIPPTETTQPAAYSNKTDALPPGVSPPYSREVPEQPMTRLQRLVVENMEMKEQLAIERDRMDKSRAIAQELEGSLMAQLKAVRLMREALQAGQAKEPAEVA